MTRVSTGSYSDTANTKQYYTSNGQIIQQSSVNAQEFLRTVTRADIVKSPSPRLKPLKPLSYSADVDEIKHIHGYIKYATSGTGSNPTSVRENWGNLNTLVTPISVPSLSSDTNLKDQAIARLLENVKNQKFNAPLAMAEITKTAATVTKTATRIYHAARDCRRGAFADAARGLGLFPHRKNVKKHPSTNEAHQAFLEMQYGWKPMLSDVQGAAEALADSLHNNPGQLWMKVQGYAKSVSHSRRVLSSGATAYEVEDIKERVYRAIAYVKPNNPYLVQASSLGITNPMNLAWELIPFSFVADWFIPVGDYLNTLDATLGWDYSCGCLIEVLHNKTVRPRWVGTHSTFIRGSISSGGGRKYKFIRTASTAFPQRALPRIKNPVSLTHVANAIALLRGLFS